MWGRSLAERGAGAGARTGSGVPRAAAVDRAPCAAVAGQAQAVARARARARRKAANGTAPAPPDSRRPRRARGRWVDASCAGVASLTFTRLAYRSTVTRGSDESHETRRAHWRRGVWSLTIQSSKTYIPDCDADDGVGLADSVGLGGRQRGARRRSVWVSGRSVAQGSGALT
ncbi:hypothetical protein GUJ93_ZPchr0005g14767 [Zizania palustris]|uniref:Uncharacterized protein n=1 Tax=Zizania palustris TaxID=103762 RepID=A0A8J5S4S1_ZIZPA|nr:hypothetical protein GUJ93_ZPchr0005g14767 [Zizania palustris]